MKSYTLGTKLIHYVVPVLTALFLAGCSSQPSQSAGKQIIEKTIQDESKGLIKLLSFRKTNATSRGNYYVMEFEVEIEYLEDCVLEGVGPFSRASRGLFKAERGSSLRGLPYQPKKKGKERRSGELEFEKTEKGWRGPDGNVY
jgi:hypothetical protein